MLDTLLCRIAHSGDALADSTRNALALSARGMTQGTEIAFSGHLGVLVIAV